MAIDYNTGISSLNAGAPDIKYTGDEGPRSPQEEQMQQMQSIVFSMKSAIRSFWRDTDWLTWGTMVKQVSYLSIDRSVETLL